VTEITQCTPEVIPDRRVVDDAYAPNLGGRLLRVCRERPRRRAA
jgi:hypothetical protein